MASLRRPGRNSLSCTTPCLMPAALALRASARATSRSVGDRLLAVDVLAGVDGAGQEAGAHLGGAGVEEQGVVAVGEGGVEVGRSSGRCRGRRASASILSASRPTRIGSGIRRSPFASATPPWARMAQIERTRCWLKPMRPVTPCMMRPKRRTAMAEVLPDSAGCPALITDWLQVADKRPAGQAQKVARWPGTRVLLCVP